MVEQRWKHSLRRRGVGVSAHGVSIDGDLFTRGRATLAYRFSRRLAHLFLPGHSFQPGRGPRCAAYSLIFPVRISFLPPISSVVQITRGRGAGGGELPAETRLARSSNVVLNVLETEKSTL